jgi:hypothetical protein
VRLAFNDPRNILLNSLYGLCRVHNGDSAKTVEWLADWTRSKSNKGSRDGQLFMFFARMRRDEPQENCDVRET